MKFSFLRYNTSDSKVTKKYLATSSSEDDGSNKIVGITIGTFDGLHTAHQILVDKLNKKLDQLSGDRSTYPVLLSLYPHPRDVLSKNINHQDPLNDFSKLLTPARARFKIAENFKLEELCLIRFSLSFSKLSARDFVKKVLVEPFAPSVIVVGYDWSFGRNREGDTHFLKEAGREFGFEVEVVDQVSESNSKIGASRVRQYLLEGKVSEANHLLGYPFTISGKVVRGAGRGSRIGIPTANIHSVRQFLPASGVYQTETIFEDKIYPSITNVGYRPTFDNNTRRPVVETHLLDTSLNLYDKNIQLKFLKWIRPEKKFGSVDDLVSQIHQDIEAARLAFG